MKKLLLILFVMLLVFVTLAGCSGQEAIEKEKAVPVAKLEIQPISMTNQVTLAGETVSNQEVLISTKIAGKIGKIYVDVGDEINTGELLFVLENQELKAAVEQAEKNLSIAQANLANIKKGARSQELEQANQAVNQAKAQLDLAEANFKRMKELFEAEAISKQQYDQALSQLQLGKATYTTSLEQKSLIEEGASEDTIKAAEAQVGLAEANLKMAQAKLDDTLIHSPISGRIGSVNFDVGEFVMQGNPVMQVIDDSKMIVEIDLSESMISEIKLAEIVQVKIQAVSKEYFQGTVTEISPAADKMSKVYPVKITINNANGTIRSGMTASVLIQLDKKQDVIAVPVDSTFEELGEFYVFTVKEDRAVKTKVKTGINNGQLVEITEGLMSGDIVIIAGQNRVTNGDLVNEGGGSQ